MKDTPIAIDFMSFMIDKFIVHTMGEQLDRDLVEGWLEAVCEKVLQDLEDSGHFAGPRQ